MCWCVHRPIHVLVVVRWNGAVGICPVMHTVVYQLCLLALLAPSLSRQVRLVQSLLGHLSVSLSNLLAFLSSLSLIPPPLRPPTCQSAWKVPYFQLLFARLIVVFGAAAALCIWSIFRRWTTCGTPKTVPALMANFGCWRWLLKKLLRDSISVYVSCGPLRKTVGGWQWDVANYRFLSQITIPRIVGWHG